MAAEAEARKVRSHVPHYVGRGVLGAHPNCTNKLKVVAAEHWLFKLRIRAPTGMVHDKTWTSQGTRGLM
jgi:hypothetical protein